jgi:hypothetical protein
MLSPFQHYNDLFVSAYSVAFGIDGKEGQAPRPADDLAAIVNLEMMDLTHELPSSDPSFGKRQMMKENGTSGLSLVP